MSMQTVWFFLIAVLFTVYFVLDGVDFGAGMLLPIACKDDKEKSAVLRAIGPNWGANEVWFITAGGAMFAAFPVWYATMFSGFYVALFLLLMAFIMRGISIEYRGKVDSPRVKKAVDICIGVSSLLLPVLLGIAMAALLRGVPIDAEGNFSGSLLSLFSPCTIFVGLASAAFFVYHGGLVVYLKLGSKGPALLRPAKTAGGIAVVLLALVIIAAFVELPAKPVPMVLLVASFTLLMVSYLRVRRHPDKYAVILNALVVIGMVAALFTALFPRVMVSSIDEVNSLTIADAASTDYTLGIMTVVLCIMLPIVTAYTIWSYRVFAKHIANEEQSEY